jgi:hypothetical protein
MLTNIHQSHSLNSVPQIQCSLSAQRCHWYTLCHFIWNRHISEYHSLPVSQLFIEWGVWVSLLIFSQHTISTIRNQLVSLIQYLLVTEPYDSNTMHRFIACRMYTSTITFIVTSSLRMSSLRTNRMSAIFTLSTSASPNSIKTPLHTSISFSMNAVVHSVTLHLPPSIVTFNSS